MSGGLNYTGLAQLVEHGPFKPVAAGSSPAIGISYFFQLPNKMNFEDVPTWAYSWCFFFMFSGIMAIVTGLGAVLFSKKIGFGVATAYMLAAFVQAATAFTMFWMCRSSLRPTQELAVQFSH